MTKGQAAPIPVCPLRENFMQAQLLCLLLQQGGIFLVEAAQDDDAIPRQHIAIVWQVPKQHIPVDICHHDIKDSSM